MITSIDYDADTQTYHSKKVPLKAANLRFQQSLFSVVTCTSATATSSILFASVPSAVPLLSTIFPDESILLTLQSHSFCFTVWDGVIFPRSLRRYRSILFSSIGRTTLPVRYRMVRSLPYSVEKIEILVEC